MIVVTSVSSGTRVELWCCICRERLPLPQAWFAFPADAQGQEGKWLHKDCAKGEVRRLFAENRAVMMRGDMALSHLALSLHYTDEE